MSIQFATRRIIDSVWTLTFAWEDGKVRILEYDRENTVGYKYEKDLPQCVIVEDDDRTVTHVRLRRHRSFDYQWAEDAGELFEVVNPQHIFSYSK